MSSSTVRILLVEDEAHIASGVMAYLTSTGYAASHIARGDDALDVLRIQAPDLLILDGMLPGVDGVQICQAARALYPRLPIIMLTARAEEEDTLRAFDAGADDYVTKPFRPAELMRRIAALMRRSQYTTGFTPAPMMNTEAAKPRALLWDANLERFCLHNTPLVLTAQEKRLLLLLYRAAPKTMGRARLLEMTREHDIEATERSIDSHIKNLRKKLNLSSGDNFIVAEYGVGYRLQLD